jgi:effector-binding domain-containing protein
MDIEIIDQPIRIHLHGLSSTVDNNCYGEVGCRLMDEMWGIVKQAGLKTTGINHWVYFPGNRMFVGIEVSDGQQAAIPEQLERCEFELPRYAKHVHVGPYQDLLQKWQALQAELQARRESVTMPSLEVYGHIPEVDDGSEPETTILMGLKPTASP